MQPRSKERRVVGAVELVVERLLPNALVVTTWPEELNQESEGALIAQLPFQEKPAYPGERLLEGTLSNCGCPY